MPSRFALVLTLLACLGAAVLAAPHAWADTWILVSDASEQPESALPEQTLAILEGLESEGHTVLFLAVGIDTKKRAKLVDLTKVLEEEGEEARLEVWAKRIERGKIDADAAPDVLEALATATRIAPPEDAVHVLLLGRFGGIPDPPGDDEEEDASGLDLWAERGVTGDRVLTTHHLAERARERIASARGYVETGWILLEAPTFTSEARPWTPFGVVRDGKVRREPAAMEARLMATVKAVGLGRSRRTASPLAVLQLKDESMRGWLTPGPGGIEISAPVNEARALTLEFGWHTQSEAFVLPLTEPPAPHTLTFGAPVADFRWRDAEGPLASRTIALDDAGEVLLVLRHSNPEALASLELLEDDTPEGVSFEARAPMAGELFVDQIVRIGWKPARTLTLQRTTLTPSRPHGQRAGRRDGHAGRAGASRRSRSQGRHPGLPASAGGREGARALRDSGRRTRSSPPPSPCVPRGRCPPIPRRPRSISSCPTGRRSRSRRANPSTSPSTSSLGSRLAWPRPRTGHASIPAP